MAALILVATLGGPFARIGMLRALNHGKPNPATARGKVFVSSRQRLSGFSRSPLSCLIAIVLAFTDAAAVPGFS